MQKLLLENWKEILIGWGILIIIFCYLNYRFWTLIGKDEEGF